MTSFCFIGLSAFAQKQPAPFKNGDRIVFAGNSITEAGFYETYIWDYYLLHFPQRKIQIMNGGIGGDVAAQMLARLDDDILLKKPNVVVLTFGMNDSRYFEYFIRPEATVRKEAVATSLASYEAIEKRFQALPDVQKIIMTSSPYDENMTGPKNNFHGKYVTMLEIANFQLASAKKNQWGFVDLMRPMNEIDLREQKRDTNYTLTGPDRIHPGKAGHLAMAYFFLASQGLKGNVVADVSINAANKKLVRATNSQVTNIKSTDDKMSFDYMANSLPFPIDSISSMWGNPQKQSEVLSVIPFINDFDKELLTVGGLRPSENYTLKIDGLNIGKWSGAEFGKGINLAVLSNTPQYKQAQKVADLNIQYHDIEGKMRSYYWLQFNFFRKKNMFYQDDEAAMDSVNTNAKTDWAVASKKDNYKDARKKEVRDGWEKQMKEIMDNMYVVNQPIKHVVTVEIEK